MKPFTYEEGLKNYYISLGSGLYKTRHVEEAMFNDQARSFLLLSSLRKRGLLNCLPWSRLSEFTKKNPQRGDKQSNWWQISSKGIATLVDVFGIKIIKEGDHKELAKFYLRNEKQLRTSKWRANKN